MDLAALRRLFGGLPVVYVATAGSDGAPHVVPLWFVWCEDALYVSTRQGSRTWANARADPRVALSLDVGRSWVELAGVVVLGRAEPLAPDDRSMRVPISLWHDKYRTLLSGDGFARFAEEVAHLAFLRVVPEQVRDWDHVRGG